MLGQGVGDCHKIMIQVQPLFNDQILLKGSSKKFMKFNLDVEIKYGHCFSCSSYFLLYDTRGRVASNSPFLKNNGEF
jgi:hypothetical protein